MDVRANEALVVTDGPDASGIVTVTMNRAEKFNALSMELMQALDRTLSALGEDPNVRVIILAAAGKAFCAGHDLKEMRQLPDEAATQALFKQCSQLMLTIIKIPKPVIARIHGIATAAGCQIVASCDLAICVDHARFGVSGVNLGLFCSTPMVALTRNVPRKAAMEMLVTGKLIDAPTALAYGLVNRVVPADTLDDAVGELASTVAAKSPAAIALGKSLFYKQIETDIQAAYELACQTMACNLRLEDAAAGIDAFVNKQPPPKWKGV